MATQSLLSLLRLCSSNLPVGGYTFSQGLEAAIEAGWLKSTDDVRCWLSDVLDAGLRQTDLPLLAWLYQALDEADSRQVLAANDEALALRETRELLLADLSMGRALLRLLRDTEQITTDSAGLPKAFFLPEQRGRESIAMVTAFAIAAHSWRIDYQSAATGYAWTVLENLVMAAAKLLPMGQTACQQMMISLEDDLQRLVDGASLVERDAIGQSLPGLIAASAYHEDQYSRLYRS